MKRSMTAILFIFFFTSCEIEKPEQSKYDPFICEEFPEQRIYYPEEKITFFFNMNVNASSLNGFQVVSNEENREFEIEVLKNTVSILPPLPSEKTISVQINSALKSFDNKPLQIGKSFTENKEVIEMNFSTGKKLPEVEKTIPADTKSATIAIKFDGKVEIKFKNIEPAPFDMLEIDNWFIFAYEKPQKEIVILKADASDRDISIENIEVRLPDKNPLEKELIVKYSVSDTKITAEINDESAIAAKIEGIYSICEKKCTLTLDNLKPETDYSIKTYVYTVTGQKVDSAILSTGEEKPHIIISEVMHSPMSEPEKSFEFIEIFNNGRLDFDLSECFIDDKNDGKGVDPLLLKDSDRELFLKPGELAVVTGNEAAFADQINNALWLTVDDTTIADAGLTSTENIQILCNREGSMQLESSANPPDLKTQKGFSFNIDKNGRKCSSKLEGGTPGNYYECE